MNILASGCLLGIPCRYDGSGNLEEAVKKLMDYHNIIPVCPEQLGGMPTPRIPCEKCGNRVMNRDGEDMTEYFKAGADTVKGLAELYSCHMAVLKERSPSCGSGLIYDGSFSGTKTFGDGVTAELLKQENMVVLGESRVEEFVRMEESGRILETERLLLRKLTKDDFSNLCTILKDCGVMYAYEHGFSDEEVTDWLERQLKRYETYGFGLWGVILKETGEFIGQCGITMQNWGERNVPEIGYLFAKAYWHKGYAVEAAKACKELVFSFFGMKEIFSIIRDNNIPSKRVAERNGMRPCGSMIKHYYGVVMPHTIYGVKPIPQHQGV